MCVSAGTPPTGHTWQMQSGQLTQPSQPIRAPSSETCGWQEEIGQLTQPGQSEPLPRRPVVGRKKLDSWPNLANQSLFLGDLWLAGRDYIKRERERETEAGMQGREWKREEGEREREREKVQALWLVINMYSDAGIALAQKCSINIY